nr:ubiquitin hydrolase [Tanacetum cinerariifolium]
MELHSPQTDLRLIDEHFESEFVDISTISSSADMTVKTVDITHKDDNSEDELSPTVEVKTVKPNVEKIESVKTPRETVKTTESHKPHKYYPRGNKRNWNNLMSHRLGSNFVFKNKACYECGSFDHLIKDCRVHKKQVKNQKNGKASYLGGAATTRLLLQPWRSRQKAIAALQQMQTVYAHVGVELLNEIPTSTDDKPSSKTKPTSKAKATKPKKPKSIAKPSSSTWANVMEHRAVDLDRLTDALDQRAYALERRLNVLGSPRARVGAQTMDRCRTIVLALSQSALFPNSHFSPFIIPKDFYNNLVDIPG